MSVYIFSKFRRIYVSGEEIVTNIVMTDYDGISCHVRVFDACPGKSITRRILVMYMYRKIITEKEKGYLSKIYKDLTFQ